MAQSILLARNLHKAYRMGRADVRVLRGASLSVAEGEFLVVMGSSGSGKSTLLHILGALDHPDQGSVEFGRHDVFTAAPVVRRKYRNRDVGFVFQFYHLLPELTVVENVAVPRLVGSSTLRWGATRRAVFRDASALLEQVGLKDRVTHRPNELSGGERQRVAVARALINRPALLLADEPTGNLDETTGAGILKLLAEFNEAGQTIVMVTHDPKVASRAHRRVLLSDGVIKETTGSEAARSGSSPVTARMGL